MTNWPDGVVDAHIHQWDPYTTPRTVSREARLVRRLPVPRAIRWALPQSDRQFIGDPRPVLRPYLPTDYTRDAASMPVSTVVHIEAEWNLTAHRDAVDETRWVAALPFTGPTLGGIVVHVDPRWTDVADVLDAHLEASPLVRGVRCSAAQHPDPGVRDFADRPDLLRDPAFVRGFAAIAERDLSFEIWCYSHQLPDALVLVDEYPQTTFVLDHYGTPVGIFGPRGHHTGSTAAARAELLARWHDDVAALAARPNVVAKHSGLGMPLLGGERFRPAASTDRMVDRVAPLVRQLHDCFGAERTLWASNFPIDKPGQTLPVSAQVLLDVLGADAAPDALFRDVARRVYRID